MSATPSVTAKRPSLTIAAGLRQRARMHCGLTEAAAVGVALQHGSDRSSVEPPAAMGRKRWFGVSSADISPMVPPESVDGRTLRCGLRQPGAAEARHGVGACGAWRGDCGGALHQPLTTRVWAQRPATLIKGMTA